MSFSKLNDEDYISLKETLGGATEDSICNCSSCKQAIKAGEKGALQLLENHCPIYLLQVAEVYSMVAVHAIMINGTMNADEAIQFRRFVEININKTLFNDIEMMKEHFSRIEKIIR